MALSGNVKGIVIEISGDTTKLDKALSGISKQTRAIDSELRTVNNALKFNPTSVTLWSNKQQLLTEKVGQTKNKLDALKKAQKQMDANGVAKSSKEYRQLQTEIEITESKLKTFKAQLAQIGNVKLKALSEKFKQIGDEAKELGQTLATKVTLPLAALGGASLKIGADFDTAMSQVAATMGKPVDEIQDLRDFAIEMGSTTAFSATQAAEGLNYMALAGYDTQTSMEMLPTVLNLAAAGAMELGDASDMVTDASSALGLSTKETTMLVDQMAKTSSTTNTSVSQLGSAILTVGGTAKTMKGGTQELTQVLGLLADNGIKGSEGGTALRNMLLSLSAPTDKAAAELSDLGIEVFDAEGNMRSMQDIMGQLNAELSNMTDEERTKSIATIFNKRDLKSVNALLGTSSDRWNEVASAIGEAGGAAGQMADTQLDNMAGSLTILKSALEGAAIAISDQLAPYVKALAEWLTDLVTKFNSLSPTVKQAIVIAGLIAAAIGPVLIIFGTVASAIGTVIGVVGKLSGMIGGLITFMGSLNPVVLIVIAAIVALIAIGVALYKNWDKVKATATSVRDTVVNAFNTLKTSLATTFNAIKTAATKTWNAIKDAITKPIEKAKTAVKKVVDTIKGLFPLKVGKIFSNIKLPKIKVSGGKPPYGLMGKGVTPSFGLEWFDKGGIFKSPSIIGVGEKRPEFVGALDDLRQIVREESGTGQIVINVYANDNMNVREVANEVKRVLINAQNRKRLAWK